MTPVPFLLSTDGVTPLEKATRLVTQDLPLVVSNNLPVVLVPYQSFWQGLSHDLPGHRGEFDRSVVPRVLLPTPSKDRYNLSFLSPGISPDCHDFPSSISTAKNNLCGYTSKKRKHRKPYMETNWLLYRSLTFPYPRIKKGMLMHYTLAYSHCLWNRLQSCPFGKNTQKSPKKQT